MTTHTLKVQLSYFEALVDGSKPFEVRRNDRAYQRDDVLVLREWHAARESVDGCRDCSRHLPEAHFGERAVQAVVTYVYAGDPRWVDLVPGHVVLGLRMDGDSHE